MGIWSSDLRTRIGLNSDTPHLQSFVLSEGGGKLALVSETANNLFKSTESNFVTDESKGGQSKWPIS